MKVDTEGSSLTAEELINGMENILKEGEEAKNVRYDEQGCALRSFQIGETGGLDVLIQMAEAFDKLWLQDLENITKSEDGSGDS